MKLSLADRILSAIERAGGPVTTTFLVRIAATNNYKQPRAQTWWNLEMLLINGYVKVHKRGRGGRPSTWLPTISRIPATRAGKAVADRNGKG